MINGLLESSSLVTEAGREYIVLVMRGEGLPETRTLRIDVTRLIDIYTAKSYAAGDTVLVAVGGSTGREISASIVAGSITTNHFEPDLKDRWELLLTEMAGLPMLFNFKANTGSLSAPAKMAISGFTLHNNQGPTGSFIYVPVVSFHPDSNTAEERSNQPDAVDELCFFPAAIISTGDPPVIGFTTLPGGNFFRHGQSVS